MVKKLLSLFSVTGIFLLATSYACKKNMTSQNQPETPANKDTIIHQRDTLKPQDTTIYSFLALGDSYTIGQSVKEEERFPAQTVKLLKAEGKITNPPLYIAATGWTTNSLANAIETRVIQGPFDIVTLLIGVNDQYQSHDTSGYRDRFTYLLKKSIKLAGNRSKHVFVLSIPDYSVTPFASQANTQMISEQIDWFNNINHQVSNNYRATYVDITPISRDAINDPTLIAFDGLHPSGKMYLRWSLLLQASIEAVLK